MIAHNKVAVGRNPGRGIVADIGILWRNVGLRNFMAIDVDNATTNLDGFSGKGDDALNKGFGTIKGIPEYDDIASIDGLKTVDELIDEDALLIGEERGHAGAFDFYGLIEEDDDDQREANGDEQVASPDANFMAKQLVRWRGCGDCEFGWQRGRGGGCRDALWRGVAVLVVFEHLAYYL